MFERVVLSKILVVTHAHTDKQTYSSQYSAPLPMAAEQEQMALKITETAPLPKLMQMLRAT